MLAVKMACLFVDGSVESVEGCMHVLRLVWMGIFHLPRPEWLLRRDGRVP